MSRDAYTAVNFTSRRTGEDDEGYLATAARMDELAAEQQGFVGIESVRLVRPTAGQSSVPKAGCSSSLAIPTIDVAERCLSSTRSRGR